MTRLAPEAVHPEPALEARPVRATIDPVDPVDPVHPVERTGRPDRAVPPIPVRGEFHPERPAPIQTPLATPPEPPTIRAEIDHAPGHAPGHAPDQGSRPSMQAEAGARISDEEFEARIERIVEREETSPFRRIIDRARGADVPRAGSADPSSQRPVAGTPSRKDLEEPSFLRRLRD